MASHPTQPNEQRRRLLKAASAAPVIFTLPVGSSVAARSVQCDAESMDNTIDNITIEDGKVKRTVGGTVEQYTITDGTVTIDGQIYFVDDGTVDIDSPNTATPRLVTGSCWGSLVLGSAGSSTHIV